MGITDDRPFVVEFSWRPFFYTTGDQRFVTFDHFEVQWGLSASALDRLDDVGGNTHIRLKFASAVQVWARVRQVAVNGPASEWSATVGPITAAVPVPYSPGTPAAGWQDIDQAYATANAPIAVLANKGYRFTESVTVGGTMFTGSANNVWIDLGNHLVHTYANTGVGHFWLFGTSANAIIFGPSRIRNGAYVPAAGQDCSAFRQNGNFGGGWLVRDCTIEISGVNELLNDNSLAYGWYHNSQSAAFPASAITFYRVQFFNHDTQDGHGVSGSFLSDLRMVECVGVHRNVTKGNTRPHFVRRETGKFDITSITQANPAVVTHTGTNEYRTDDIALIERVNGMTQVNDKCYKLTRLSSSQVSLKTLDGSAVDSTSFAAYTSGGILASMDETDIDRCTFIVEDVASFENQGFVVTSGSYVHNCVVKDFGDHTRHFISNAPGAVFAHNDLTAIQAAATSTTTPIQLRWFADWACIANNRVYVEGNLGHRGGSIGAGESPNTDKGRHIYIHGNEWDMDVSALVAMAFATTDPSPDEHVYSRRNKYRVIGFVAGKDALKLGGSNQKGVDPLTDEYARGPIVFFEDTIEGDILFAFYNIAGGDPAYDGWEFRDVTHSAGVKKTSGTVPVGENVNSYFTTPGGPDPYPILTPRPIQVMAGFGGGEF